MQIVYICIYIYIGWVGILHNILDMSSSYWSPFPFKITNEHIFNISHLQDIHTEELQFSKWIFGHEWGEIRHSWKSLANHIMSDQKNNSQ